MRELNYLIADDSATVRKLVAKSIETRLGATQIYQAHDGSDALKILKANKIDMIISDWDMPGLTGDDFLYQVRNNEDWKHIPFIMMTSHGGKDFIVTAIQLGVSQYIVKPFSPEELEEKLRKSWNSASKRKGIRYASIPRHKLIIKVEGKSLSGEVLNLSRIGILIRMTYVDGLKLFGNYEIGLAIERADQKEPCIISPVIGKAVRLESDSSMHSNSQVCLMALYFDHTSMNKKVEDILLDFLKWLNSQGPETIPAE